MYASFPVSHIPYFLAVYTYSIDPTSHLASLLAWKYGLHPTSEPDFFSGKYQKVRLYLYIDFGTPTHVWSIITA